MPTLKHIAKHMEDFFNAELHPAERGGTSSLAVQQLTSSALRHGAQSPFNAVLGGGNCVATVERALLTVATQRSSYERVGRFCKKVPLSDGRPVSLACTLQSCVLHRRCLGVSSIRTNSITRLDRIMV